MLQMCRVVIKGAGDMASGVAHRLHYAGFEVIMLELPAPLVVRRSVSFADAVFRGNTQVEGVQARLCTNVQEVEKLLPMRLIPLMIDPEGSYISSLRPQVLVDAIMMKKNTGTSIVDAPIVIALGPGFIAGKNAHAVIETKRGHNLGRAIYVGTAAENTGIPDEIYGATTARVLRAPTNGSFVTVREIGELVAAGDTVATVGHKAVRAGVDGILRGLLYSC